MVILKGCPLPVTLRGTNKIKEQMERSICKVYSDNGNEKGTGFFCYIKPKNIPNIKIPCLITANYIINANRITHIRIMLNEKEKIIQINDNRTIYSNEEYQTTIIEIKPEDNIDYFLDIDENIYDLKSYDKDKYNNMSAYLIYYCEKEKEVKVSYGLNRVFEDSYGIFYYCSTESGSGGSPIFCLETNEVIGIHSGNGGIHNYNKGSLLTIPVIEFLKPIESKLCNSKDFTNLKLISSGNYGEVYSAFNIRYKTEICLKKINLEKMKLYYEENRLTDYLKDLNNEIAILKLLSNNYNSVKFYGAYDENNEKVIIMEKCDKNLKQFIKERGKGMEIEEIKNKFRELNQLFKEIQNEKIIHRDLKLENFLIKYTDKKKTEYIIKLCDYGIGKFKNQSNGIFSGLKGSFDTVAPEIILQKTKTYENTVDIFSLGIILYQISHNLKHPFGNSIVQSGKVYLSNYEQDNLTIEFNKSIKNNDFIDLITKMIKLNPKNRLTWDEYFDHPFFQ